MRKLEKLAQVLIILTVIVLSVTWFIRTKDEEAIIKIIGVLGTLYTTIKGWNSIRKARNDTVNVKQKNEKFISKFPEINKQEFFSPRSKLYYILKNNMLLNWYMPSKIRQKPIRFFHLLLCILLSYIAYKYCSDLYSQREVLDSDFFNSIVNISFSFIFLFFGGPIVVFSTKIIIYITIPLNRLYEFIFIRKKESYFKFIFDSITKKPIDSYSYSYGSNKTFLYIAKLDEKYGLLDSSYTQILPAVFDNISLLENYIEVNHEGKKGLYNYNGVIALPVKYDHCSLKEDFVEVFENGNKKRISKYGARSI